MGRILSYPSNLLFASVEKDLNANNTTANVNLFQLTGRAILKNIYGVLTSKTTLANMTGVHFNLNDGTNTVVITKNDGVGSSLLVGGIVAKVQTTTTTAMIHTATQCNVQDLNTFTYPCWITQKNGANTYIRFTYTTTDAPMAAKMKFYIEYQLLDENSNIVIV